MIIAFLGRRGRGKTLGMLAYGLALAEKHKIKNLCFNFSIKYEPLLKYCKMQEFWWNVYLLQHGFIHAKSGRDLESFMRFKNCIYFFDEGGVYIKSRNWSKTPEEFLDDLALSRKGGKILLYTAQNHYQIDKALLNHTERIVHCDGWISYPKGSPIPQLIAIKQTDLDMFNYERWLERQYTKRSLFSGLKAKSLTHSETFNFIGRKERLLFQAYDSFEEVPDQPEIVGKSKCTYFCRKVTDSYPYEEFGFID